MITMPRIYQIYIRGRCSRQYVCAHVYLLLYRIDSAAEGFEIRETFKKEKTC